MNANRTDPDTWWNSLTFWQKLELAFVPVRISNLIFKWHYPEFCETYVLVKEHGFRKGLVWRIRNTKLFQMYLVWKTWRLIPASSFDPDYEMQSPRKCNIAQLGLYWENLALRRNICNDRRRTLELSANGDMVQAWQWSDIVKSQEKQLRNMSFWTFVFAKDNTS